MKVRRSGRKKAKFGIFKNKTFFSLALLSVLCVIGSALLARHKQNLLQYAATSPVVYFGVHTNNNFWDFTTTYPFETAAGKPASIVMDYQDWDFGLNDGASNFSPTWMNQVRSHGSIPLVTWEPQNYQTGANDPTYQLKNIYNGNYDAYLTKWAQDAKAWGYPFFLRFAHEMNGNFYPWCEQVNGNQPGDYVKAWRHVHDIFTQQGATNVTWVWSPNIDANFTIPLSGLYPGDAYVDWVGMDGYNWGPSQSWSSWTSFIQTFQQTYNDLQTIAPSKPVMIAETASTELGGSKANWITDAYTTQLPTNFPKIKAVIWFDVNKESDWRIESSTTAQQAFATAIASPYYASNQFGSITNSPIMPLVAPTPTPTPTNTPAPTRTSTPTPTNLPTPRPTSTPTPSPTPVVTNLIKPVITNLIKDGSFEYNGTYWLTPWIFALKSGANGVITPDSTTKVDGSYSTKISVLQSNWNAFYVQLQQGNVPLTAGRKNTISFWAKAAKNRSILVGFNQNYAPYTTYYNQVLNITTSWHQYSLYFTPQHTDSNTLFSFNVANSTGSIWFDKVILQ